MQRELRAFGFFSTSVHVCPDSLQSPLDIKFRNRKLANLIPINSKKKPVYVFSIIDMYFPCVFVGGTARRRV